MREKIIVGYLRGKMACQEALENFLKEEKGASTMVEVLLIIVILIAVAAIFRRQLTAAVEGVFTQLNDALGI